MVPSMPGGNGGEHLMGLPLREAREAFEREYLPRANQPLRRQYFPHCGVCRHGGVRRSTASSRHSRWIRRTIPKKCSPVFESNPAH